MSMARILDLEQSLLLLELEAPFDKRQVQLARRRMAKVWHPDIAPPGRQHEHQRHLQAINEAADQLERWPKHRAAGPSAATRSRSRRLRPAGRALRRALAPTQPSSARSSSGCRPNATNDPFGARVPDHSVVHRYARCISYPEWGVGTVSGIYFSGDGDDVQQWARMSFQVGVRTVPAGSLQFVDFSTPDPGAERVERFMTAAQHALAEGNPALAAQRLIYARDADPTNPAVLRLLTVAFWQSGNLAAAGRAVRDWGRAETDRPTAGEGATPRASTTRTWARLTSPPRRPDKRVTPACPRRRVRVGATRPAAAAPAAAPSRCGSDALDRARA